jgi:hypothetical protein
MDDWMASIATLNATHLILKQSKGTELVLWQTQSKDRMPLALIKMVASRVR